jgi:hypothetical protein
MDFARKKAVALVCLIVYVCIGFSAHALSPESENAYPFFSWFLFVQVPPRVQTGFEVRVVLATSTQPIRTSADFDAHGLMQRDIIMLEARIGHAVKGGNPEEIRTAREGLEARMTSGAKYELVEITYNPLEYFKNKTTHGESVLAQFITP